MDKHSQPRANKTELTLNIACARSKSNYCRAHVLFVNIGRKGNCSSFVFWLLRGIAAPSVSASTAVPAEMHLHFTPTLVTLKRFVLSCLFGACLLGEGNIFFCLFFENCMFYKETWLMFQPFYFPKSSILKAFVDAICSDVQIFLFHVVECGFCFCSRRTRYTHVIFISARGSWTLITSGQLLPY